MANDAMEKQNIILKEMIDASWNCIGMISLDSKFVYLNKAFSPVLGFTISELQQKSILDIILPKSKDIFEKTLKQSLENGTDNKIMIGCLRKNNKIVYLDLAIKLMTNKTMFLINAVDVTEQVTEEQVLNRFVVRLRLDKFGTIKDTTEAFNRLSGYARDEIKEQNYTELIHYSTKEDVKTDFIDHIERGKPWKGMISFKKKDETAFWVDFMVKPIKNKYADIIGHNAVMIDISGEINLQKNQEILKERVMDGEEKLTIMSETMRTVAHEWRQPLNAISLDAQALLFDLEFDDEVSKDSLTEKLESISSNTKDLSAVIETFQSITELKSSKKKRNIKEIINEALKIAELEGSFIEQTNEDTKAFRTYPKELSAAMSSILVNAKEITALKEDKKIWIKSSQVDNHIVCEISNNGGHIPEDIIEKIFTPYFSTKEEKNGVGLSLYNSKMIIELHLKGRIEVSNIDESIVMFKLTFPMGALE
ncbi:MAG TPA: PAS domain-containing sensor histidine kinase [Arcobacter sp.]|nr:PAS domain-containing sensor histidine kinase [Arcobacter sp.]